MNPLKIKKSFVGHGHCVDHIEQQRNDHVVLMRPYCVHSFFKVYSPPWILRAMDFTEMTHCQILQYLENWR